MAQYLDHAISTPAFHPLNSTFLVECRVTLTVQDKLVVGTVHHQGYVQVHLDPYINKESPLSESNHNCLATFSQNSLKNFSNLKEEEIPKNQNNLTDNYQSHFAQICNSRIFITYCH